MKYIKTLAVIIGLIIFSAEITRAAVINEERGYINVSTNTSAEVPADVAEIKIAVKTADTKSMLNATNENNKISDRVYAAVKGMINTDNGDYVKTTNFNAAPIYTNSVNGKKIFDKYEVSNTILVHTKNIAKIGDIIDKALSLGAANISDLEFSLSDYEAYCNDLIAVTAVKAKTRADIAAKNTSSYITGIKSMDVSCSTNNINKVKYRLYAKTAGVDSVMEDTEDTSTAAHVQSGNIKIFANINASYFVK